MLVPSGFILPSYTGDGSALTGVGGKTLCHAEQVNVSGTDLIYTDNCILSHRNLIIPS